MRSSTDIWFIAFLKYRGYTVISYELIGKNRVKCNFSLSEEDWQRLKLEFSNGEFIKYKTLVEQVKDLAY